MARLRSSEIEPGMTIYFDDTGKNRDFRKANVIEKYKYHILVDVEPVTEYSVAHYNTSLTINSIDATEDKYSIIVKDKVGFSEKISEEGIAAELG